MTKWKWVTIFFVVMMMFVGIVYFQNENTQRVFTRLRGQLVRLDKYIGEGKLNKAESIVNGMKIDLLELDTFCALPSTKGTRHDLLARLESLERDFGNKLSSILSVLNRTADFIKAGKIKEAEHNVKVALATKIFNEDSILVVLAKYFERLKVQDYIGADSTISALKSNLPADRNLSLRAYMNLSETMSTLSGLVSSGRKKFMKDIPESSPPKQTYNMIKTCSACKKEVTIFSHAGQHCPHCGAFWSSEF